MTSVLLLSGIALAGCSNQADADDPAAVLADYQEARNAGDVEALMALYAEDAVVTAHPLDHTPPDATGVDEIRRLEAQVPGTMATEDATEYSEVEVSGNRAAFTQRFVNIAGSCFSSGGNEIVVEHGMITQYTWGDETADVCP